MKKEYESPEVYIQEFELEGALCGNGDVLFSGIDDIPIVTPGIPE